MKSGIQKKRNKEIGFEKKSMEEMRVELDLVPVWIGCLEEDEEKRRKNLKKEEE